MLLIGADDRQEQQGWLALLLRAPEASLAVGWTVAASRLRARFLGAESTASAEPQSLSTANDACVLRDSGWLHGVASVSSVAALDRILAISSYRIFL